MQTFQYRHGQRIAKRYVDEHTIVGVQLSPSQVVIQHDRVQSSSCTVVRSGICICPYIYIHHVLISERMNILFGSVRICVTCGLRVAATAAIIICLS